MLCRKIFLSSPRHRSAMGSTCHGDVRTDEKEATKAKRGKNQTYRDLTVALSAVRAQCVILLSWIHCCGSNSIGRTRMSDMHTLMHHLFSWTAHTAFGGERGETWDRSNSRVIRCKLPQNNFFIADCQKQYKTYSQCQTSLRNITLRCLCSAMAGSGLLSAVSDYLRYLPFFVVLVTCLYMIYGAIYRLYLCPIAKFPGPRFAALTFWNEFYYDVWLGGKYTWKLLDYHEQYGLPNDSSYFQEEPSIDQQQARLSV